MPGKRNKNMNILIMADFTAKYPGAFVQSLVALSHKITKNGGKIVFLFSVNRNYHTLLEHFGSVYVNKKALGKKWSWSLLKQVLIICKKYKISIIHVHFGLAFRLASCLSKMVYGCKLIWHWRSPPIGTLPNISKWHIFSPIVYNLLDKLCVDLHIAISNDIRNILIDKHYAKAGKVRIIHNAINVPELDIKKESDFSLIESRIKVNVKGRPIVGAIANFGPAKDYDTLLKAAEYVKKEFSNVAFLLVGDNKTGDGK